MEDSHLGESIVTQKTEENRGAKAMKLKMRVDGKITIQGLTTEEYRLLALGLIALSSAGEGIGNEGDRFHNDLENFGIQNHIRVCEDELVNQSILGRAKSNNKENRGL